MKKLFISTGLVWGLLFFMSERLYAQTCPNLDFSAANFSYWQAYTGKWLNTTIITPNPPGVNTPNRHVIMNAAVLIANNKFADESCSAIKKVPNGFAYSAKLGNNSTGSELEALEYTITIDSTNALLMLHFAWVMQDPQHVATDQPRFSMTIKDSLGKTLDEQVYPCSYVEFISNDKLPNIIKCSTVNNPNVAVKDLYGRDWTTVGFDFTAYMNKTIKVYFETRDCRQGAHYGYAYLVGECRPFVIDITFCDGEKDAKLTAPLGFADYIWTRSSNLSWKKQGSNQQTISVSDPQEGEVFTCKVISALKGCDAELKTTIIKTVIKADFNLIAAYDTCTRTAIFADSSYVINGKKASIRWEIPALGIVSSDSSFSYTFPDPNQTVDYLVQLTIETENGCEKTKEQFIRIYPSPEVEIQGIDQLCVGDSTWLKPIALRTQFINHIWTWEDENKIQYTVSADSINIQGKRIYWLESTNDVGCKAKDSMLISTFSEPYVSLTGNSNPLQSCSLNNGTIEVSPQNAALPVTYLWMPTGETTAKIDSLQAGIYTLRMTDANGCHADTSFEVGFYPMPYIVNILTLPETCNRENATVTFDVWSQEPTTVTYSWNGGKSDTNTYVTGLKAGTYQITIQDTLCTIDTTITIDHVDIPHACFTVTPDTCTRIVTFTDFSSVTNGKKESILWEIPALNITSTDSLFSHHFPDPKIKKYIDYEVRLTIMAGNQCADTSKDNTTIYSSPEIAINGVDLLCVGDSTSLNAVVLNSQFVDYTWTWANGQNLAQTAKGDSLKIYHSGTYLLTATNTENCTAWDTINVLPAIVPNIEVTNNTWETCEKRNGFIEITYRNALLPVSYEWKTNNAQDTTNRLDNLSAGTYQVSITDANGCHSDTSIVVNLYPTPTVFVSEMSETCRAENGSIVLTVNSARPSTVTYFWEGTKNTTNTYTGLKAGSYRAIIKDTLCLVDTTIIVETIDGLITDFNLPSYDTCNRTAVFTDSSFIENGNIVFFAWEIPQLKKQASGTSFTYTFPDPQTDKSEDYLVRLTTTTQNGCVQYAESLITVYSSPKIKIVCDDILCVGDSVALKAIPIKSKFITHEWNWQDASGLNHTAWGDSIIIYNQGKYNVKSCNTESCTSQDATMVIEAPIPEITVTTNAWETCDAENGYIEISTEKATFPVKYMWDTGRKKDTTNRIDQLKTGLYHVMVIDSNGCYAQKEIMLDAYRLPYVANVEKITEKCHRSDGEISLTVNSESPASLSYRWDGFSNTTSALTGLKAGTYRVFIQDSLCTIDTIIGIAHVEGPQADFEISSYSLIVNAPFTLTDMSIGTVQRWNWDMNDGHKLTGKTANYSYNNAGDYKIFLEVIDENGCIDTASKMINIFKLEVYVPNIFTPNDDGVNEVWKPVMTEYSTEGYRLSVFDRWGQRIFHTTDTETGWDGRTNGNAVAPNTVYSYQLVVRDYLGMEYTYVGKVTLIR